MAESKAQIVKSLTSLTTAIDEYAKKVGELNGFDSAWLLPPDWEEDQLESFQDSLHKKFDRSELNELVSSSISSSDPGPRSDFIAAQMMLSMLATHETAQRLRYSSFVSRMGYHKNRLLAHSGTDGLIKGNHLAGIENLIKAGASTTNA